jgi:DNA repair protein RadC
MENAMTNTEYPLDAGLSINPLLQERRKSPRKTINGIVYVRDSFGGYIPESFMNSKVKVRVPKDALPALATIRLSPQEIVMAIDLDGNNQIAHVRTVTVGLANQSQIHPREIFRGAIANGAVSVLIAHNHPSGNLEPSEADLIATRRLVEVGKTVGIPVLDHLILSANGFASLREKYPAYFS